MLQWYRRIFRGGPRPKLSAQLIAPRSEFDEAIRLADPETAKALIAGRASVSDVDQIGAAVSARLELAKLMSTNELIRYVQHLQNRYGVAVGPSTYDRYKQGVPVDVFSDLDKLQAELKTLSYRLRLAYSITHIRDGYLAIIRASCAWGLAASLLLVTVAIYAQQATGVTSPAVNFMIVAVVGLAGAITSIARRSNQIVASSPLEDDPVIQASGLQQGAASLFVAALTGPVFALILLVIFMGGALQIGDLTPAFLHELTPSNCPTLHSRPADFKAFQYAFWFTTPFDAVKLLMWAFIAGFAEQFVPDILDSFTKTAEDKAKPGAASKPKPPKGAPETATE